jgi:hypothetical protein
MNSIRLDSLIIESDDDTEECEIKSNTETLEIYSDRHPFSLSLRISNFENEAMYKKFVKNCEHIIRKSIEYKEWRNYIIDVLQTNECMITHEKMDEVTIEVHHHVPSLYTLTTALVNRCIEENIPFCTFDICQQAIELHFQNRVGYVTLLKSMHEKFHNGKLDIPISFVRGDYNYFIREYSRYLDEADLETINSRLIVNEHTCSWARNDYPESPVSIAERGN